MIQIEESNPSFESCNKCIYSDDSEETCILRRCIHAVAQLEECYVPKQPTIEPERKKGRWINHRCDDGHHIADCDQCGHSLQWFDDGTPKYCCECGAKMEGKG